MLKLIQHLKSYSLSDYKAVLFHNSGYKLVGLLVSLVLWTTIQGRKTQVVQKNIPLQVLLSPTHNLLNRIPTTIEVKVSGARAALDKFDEYTDSVTVDLRKQSAGVSFYKIKNTDVVLPVGVKIISLKPRTIRIAIKK